MNIIISYCNDEEIIADTIIDWIESTFFDRCKIIKSGSINGFSKGSLWIKQEFQPSSLTPLFINIIGPDTFKNASLIFQTGCAWSKGIPILSICHSGMNKNNLVHPFRNFQAIDAESPAFAKNIIMLIAKLLKIKKIPRIAFGDMNAEIIHVISVLSGKKTVCTKKQPIEKKSTRTVFSEISEELTGIFSQDELKTLGELSNGNEDNQKRVKYVFDNSEPETESETAKKNKPGPETSNKNQVKKTASSKQIEKLDEIEIKMLIVISDHDRTGCSIYQLTGDLNMTIAEIETRLKRLETKKYISPSQALFEEPKYYLTKKSIDYIIKNNINLNMI